jgi:hypothetical protein
MSCYNIYNIYNKYNILYNRLQQTTTAGARMGKSYARHIMATNLLTTTNNFPSAAMARVAYLLANDKIPFAVTTKNCGAPRPTIVEPTTVPTPSVTNPPCSLALSR